MSDIVEVEKIFLIELLKKTWLVDGFSKKPCTYSPITVNQRDSYQPSKPVWSVKKTTLFFQNNLFIPIPSKALFHFPINHSISFFHAKCPLVAKSQYDYKLQVVHHLPN